MHVNRPSRLPAALRACMFRLNMATLHRLPVIDDVYLVCSGFNVHLCKLYIFCIREVFFHIRCKPIVHFKVEAEKHVYGFKHIFFNV